MPAFVKQLREEITRIVNRRLRESTLQIKKTMAQQRLENVTLKNRLKAIEQELKGAGKNKASAQSVDKGEPRRQVRFSATGFASWRKKLSLNAAQAAALLGVSDQSVYKWEQGKTRPRSAQLHVLAEVRKMGKRELGKRLAPFEEPKP
jgi:DNA-binding transcriptional regulator YiaG